MLQVGRDTNLRERKKNYLVFGFFFSGEEDVLDRILELEITFLFIYTM